MNRRLNSISSALVAVLLLSTPNLHASDRVASQADLDRAVAATLTSDTAARKTITNLLETSEVRDLAKGMGVDVRQAVSAVGTLQGAELQRAAALATDATSQLTGGAQSVTISLVSLLLIIIIIILVA
jgi:hypothetical protein